MIKPNRKALTWGTVTAAVLSAFWLTADEGDRLEGASALLSPASEHALPTLPSAPTAAGSARPMSRALPAERKREAGH